jgi:rSAM/selenodomain-associated transferase 2/rSAM/selenodomain-associated transferase 1
MTSSEHASVAARNGEPEPGSSGHIADQRIIVMARWPEAGKAKTRLIPALGPDGAAKLHTCLVRRTLKTVCGFTERHRCEIDVQFAGGTPDDMRHLFGDHLRYTPQQGDSLGDRMSAAIGLAFAQGCHRVVVIGTDCPQLQARHLEEAFSSLHHTDVAIGPAVDGGYYLIAVREHAPGLFQDINWGSETVLRQTLQHLRRINRTRTLLPWLSDVDFPEDLVVCRQWPEEFVSVLPEPAAGVLSVIIPTLNEEPGLPGLLEQLREETRIEVIVSDGGSSDATCQLAEQSGVKLIRGNKGRGRQMNAGAALARGEVLLFLHADARLPADFAQTIWNGLRPDSAGGAFQLRIDDPRWRYRLVEFGANLRSRWFQVPYGDQGLFIRSDAFFAMNGFQNWPLLEDLDFARRLRRRGRILIADSSVTVSARRWQRIGVLKATLLNQIIVLAFQLGVSPEKLARLYGRSK